MTKSNARTLDDIAESINNLKRSNLFDIGDLLIEAKETCEHGDWLNWLDVEFDWTADTAQNYMKAAELAVKNRTVRFLKVPVRVVYWLAGEEDDVASDAIARLKAATKRGRVTAARGRDIIDLARIRNEHGDFPEETLKAIDRAEYYCDAEAIVAALKEAMPTTEAEAEAIVATVRPADEAEAEDETEAELKAILDGPPPELPPTQTPSPEATRFVTETETAWLEDFDSAVAALTRLKTRRVKEFVGTKFAPADLLAVAEFVEHVAATLAPQVARAA